jgi:hypothetical protein
MNKKATVVIGGCSTANGEQLVEWVSGQNTVEEEMKYFKEVIVPDAQARLGLSDNQADELRSTAHFVEPR